MVTTKGGGGPVGPPSGNRVTFYAFPAFVGRITAVRYVDWWPNDPNTIGWGSPMIGTDLSKTPWAAARNECSYREIQCDDHRTDEGLTSIGPRFPQGTSVGGMWLSDFYLRVLAERAPVFAPPDCWPYELTSLAYIDPPNRPQRFYGFHAKIVNMSGTVAEVELWQPGRSKVERPFGCYWFDLAQDAHPVAAGATQISQTGQEGALFLNEVATTKTGPRFPKIPYWLGADF
jgi:hypothetical protein